MTFDRLLRDRHIEPVSIEPGEIAELVRLAERDVRTSSTIMNADLDWAFAVAYNGILQVSVAYMAARGYRPRSRNKHLVTFEFMAEALPDEKEMVDRLQRLRRKRNATVYERVGLVGESEAKDIIAFAQRFLATVLALMPSEVLRRLSNGE